ncbi:glycosyl hydrolase family 32 [Phocaeicola coprocola DSM 17136]|uniref:Glycosyl hydrolase family 32 n=1 Tax=Phocaeicola coprocola DSM 17136 TaxID=470145 RepID=B3JPV3_9BACT|nr:glycosyl hydrolase family 32 [Phocaeicola coprocola DSM 17136]
MSLNFSSKKSLLAIALGLSLTVQGAENSMVVKYLANEQNIILLDSVKKFLLLPVQENAPEGKVNIIVNNEFQLEQNINIRLAREKVDYYVPLDLSAYQGKSVSVDVTGMPVSSLCWKEIKLSDTFYSSNRETYRPVYHHTPVYGWMNDPNGMFYKDGVYHLYFQYNPYGSMWGNMTWGHSTSTDLTHWTYEGTAIVPDAWGAIFSGSCVVDKDNTAGFGKGAVVAFYTSAKSTPWGDVQSQSMAYSLDNGKTFIKYEHNPILTSAERDFRDPKVFWYAPGKHWVMMLAVGQEMQIYSSGNLKEWKKESSFGAMQGAHGGVWECPDLVELPIEGTKEKKWVLICNLNPGGPFGGSAAQYFVGSFDGKKFVNESPTQTKWLDWGKDNYATVTWSNAPAGRCIALGWMSNWQYANNVPTTQYRSANTLARDLTLYRVGGELYLKSKPSPEIKKARAEEKKIPTFEVKGNYEVASLLADNKGAYEIEMAIENKGTSKIDFSLMNEKGEKVAMYYDVVRKQFVMDRSASGIVGFSRDFPAVTVAPVRNTDQIHLRLFIDRSSVEAFGEEGEYVMTNLVFPAEPYNRMVFSSDKGSYIVKSMNVYRLQ